MSLTKLLFQPGIVRETTEYSQSGGWFDCDKVRFRAGHPEKMGGWQAIIETPMQGVCRFIHQWANLESDRYIGLGTSSHLYILWSENYYDITPLRATVGPLPANPFVTGPVGSYVVTVNVPAHGASVGDYVTFSGATTGADGYTAAQLNQQFQVASVIDADHFTITMPAKVTTAGVAGGGAAVSAAFLIPAGQADAVSGMGWGVPPWGGTAPGIGTTVGWGEPFDSSELDPANPSVNQLRLWDLDNFGQDLVANIRGGPIYYWHHESGLSSRALPLNQAVTIGGVTFTPVEAPTTASQVLVSPNDRHLIAFGCDHPEVGITKPDLLLVRWATEEDAYTWNPLRTNSAGDQRLSAGSYIISAMRTRQEILIWTDLGLWSMRYIGMPYVFGFDSIAEGLSIIGPNAAINAGNSVMWMDRGIFYVYTGQTQELSCALKDYVFGDFNYLQAYKTYAGHNHAFGEVIWFYPSAASLENDRYVAYNYVDQVWSKGQIERTAWLNMGRASYPVASDRASSLLYYHEYGNDADGEPLPAWIDSADIDIDGGEHYLFLSRVIPDCTFRGQAPLGQQAVGLTIFGRSDPGSPKRVLSRIQVTPQTGLVTIRVRERQISFRIESTAAGTSWRWGVMRTDMQPDGRR